MTHKNRFNNGNTKRRPGLALLGASMAAAGLLGATSAYAVGTSIVSITPVTAPNNPNPTTRTTHPYQLPVAVQYKVVVKAASGKNKPSGNVSLTIGSNGTVSGTLAADSSCSTCASVTLPALTIATIGNGAGSSPSVNVNYAGNSAAKMDPSSGYTYTGFVGAYTNASVTVSSPANKVQASGSFVGLTGSITGGITPYSGVTQFSLEQLEAYSNPLNITTAPVWSPGQSSSVSGAPTGGVYIYVPGLYRVKINNINDTANMPCSGPSIANSGEPNRCVYDTVKIVSPTKTTVSVSKTNPKIGEEILLSAKVEGMSGPGGTVSFVNYSNQSEVFATAPVDADGNARALAAFSGLKAVMAKYSGDETSGNPASNSWYEYVSPVSSYPERTTIIGYFAEGHVRTTKDAMNNVSTLTRNRLSDVTESRDPAGFAPSITTYEVDRLGNTTSVTDSRGNKTSYTVDSFGQETQTVSPDTGAASAVFDTAGRMTSKTDARGKTSTFQYDSLGRITSATYTSGTPTQWEYDGGATPVAKNIGKITKVTDESGQTVYDWNVRGQLESKIQTTNGKTFTQSYEYGTSGPLKGKLLAQALPSKARIVYTYDDAGELTSLGLNPVNAAGTGADTATLIPLITDITRNPEGKVTGWQWVTPASGQDTAHTISYDLFGSVSGYTMGYQGGEKLTRTITRDEAGKITGYQTTGAVSGPLASLNQTFAYEGTLRLRSANVGSSVFQYAYDGVSNRIQESLGASTYNNTIAATSNRLSVDGSVAGSANLTFDAAGNTLTDGNATYTYSDRGRLASATVGGVTTQYQYNAFEQRVAKLGANTSYFVYEGVAGNLVGEYDANGAPVYETVYLGDVPLAVVKTVGSAGSMANTVHYIHSDHLATPRFVVDRENPTNVRWRWDQAEPFGATAADANPMGLGSFVFNQRFPGQVYDAETGLHQNWRRTYNPKTGRYLESDPIGLDGGTNTYEYVGGVPTMLTDPTGEILPVAAAVAIGGAAAGALGQAIIEYDRTDGKMGWQSAANISIAALAGAMSGGFGNSASVAFGLASAKQATLGEIVKNVKGYTGLVVAQLTMQGSVRASTGFASNVSQQMVSNGGDITKVNYKEAATMAALNAVCTAPVNGAFARTAQEVAMRKGWMGTAEVIERAAVVPPTYATPLQISKEVLSPAEVALKTFLVQGSFGQGAKYGASTYYDHTKNSR